MAEYSAYRDETGPAVDLDYCMERLLKSGYKVTRFRASTPLRDSVQHTPSTPLRDSVQHTTSTPLHDYVHHTIPVPVMDSLPATRPGGPPERPPPPMFYPYGFQQHEYQGVPQVSYFSGESGKGDVEFEIWKYEVGCLIRSGMYRENVVLEAVRRSLKGKSRTVLLHLGEWATIGEVMR